MLRKQGHLALVLIAAPLAGCGPDANDTPQAVTRAQYASLEDCLHDWRSPEECSAQPAATETGASSPGHGGGGVRPRMVWWGPYYTRGGTVYHYDGNVTQQAVAPTRASAFTNETLAAHQMYNRPGYIASGPKGRGGFGNTGRAASGGG